MFTNYPRNLQAAPRPKRCPNPECEYHLRPLGSSWFLFRGTGENQRHGKVRYYFCTSCSRSFSSATFLVSYYEKVDISYEKILFYAEKDISLSQWARYLETTPATLKLRLCKLGWLLLKKASDNLPPGFLDCLLGIHEMVARGEKSYPILRFLIVQLKEVLAFLRSSGAKLSRGRSFLSDLLIDKKNLFCQLRQLCCRWYYRLAKGIFYYTKYQWE